MGVSLISEEVIRSHRGQRTAKVRKVRMKKAKKAGLADEAKKLGITVTALVRLRQQDVDKIMAEANTFAARASAAAARAFEAERAKYSRRQDSWFDY